MIALMAAFVGIFRLSDYKDRTKKDPEVSPEFPVVPVMLSGQIGFRWFRRGDWSPWNPRGPSDCPTPLPWQPIEDDGSYFHMPPRKPGPFPWYRSFVFLDWGHGDVYRGLVPSTRCPPQEPTRSFWVSFFVIRVQGLVLAAIFGFYPLVYFFRLRRVQIRRRRGLCVECAYNLTSNTTGICPECGTKIDLIAVHSPQRDDGV
jgi:hypothetical protein